MLREIMGAVQGYISKQRGGCNRREAQLLLLNTLRTVMGRGVHAALAMWQSLGYSMHSRHGALPVSNVTAFNMGFSLLCAGAQDGTSQHDKAVLHVT